MFFFFRGKSQCVLLLLGKDKIPSKILIFYPNDIQLVKGSEWRSQRYLQKSQNLSGTRNAIVLCMYWG